MTCECEPCLVRGLSVPVNDRLGSVEVLDTVSGTWSTAAPMPTPRMEHQCAVVGSLLFALGGLGASNK